MVSFDKNGLYKVTLEFPSFQGFYNEDNYICQTIISALESLLDSDKEIDNYNIDYRALQLDIAKLHVTNFQKRAHDFIFAINESIPVTKHFSLSDKPQMKLFEKVEFNSIEYLSNYNYNNKDIIYMDVYFKLEHLFNIVTVLSDNGEYFLNFEDFLTENFSPYDGYIPPYSNVIDSDDWKSLGAAIQDESKLNWIFKALFGLIPQFNKEENEWEYYVIENDLLEMDLMKYLKEKE